MPTNFLHRSAAACAALCAAILLVACGGGEDAAPPPQQQGTVVGAAGGTVTGAAGAQVVIPAGALAGDVTIGIEVVAAGAAPALPINTNSVGLFLALTPHGQSFAQPVTVTIPFDPAQVPAGAQLRLFKTDNGASGPWVEVAGATVAGNVLIAQVTGFSLFTVALLPQITRQPQNIGVVVGQPATFSVFAIGFSPPFTFQWQRSNDGGTSFADIAGATNSSYTTAATVFADANAGGDNGAQFRAIVGNAGGSITSAAATLTVTLSVVAPTITQNPQSLSVNVGASVRFSCLADGTNVAYQWREALAGSATFNDMPGRTNPDLDLSNVQANQSGNRYLCHASNTAGAATSNAATLTVTSPPPAGVAGRLAAGKQHSLAVLANGTLQSWGVVSNFLEIGRGAPGNVPGAVAPNIFTGQVKVRSVAAGQWHSIAVMEDGTAYSFGYGLYGGLGQSVGSIFVGPTAPGQIPNSAVFPVIDACAGQFHTIVLRQVVAGSNEVRGVGGNEQGQMGNGTTGFSQFAWVTASPAGLSNFDPPPVAVGCGWNHTLALMQNGQVRAWGLNASGQLGNGTTVNQSRPVPVVDASGTALSDVRAVAGGEHHSLALKNDGTVWAWGSNSNGKLGDDTGTDSARPVQVRLNGTTFLTDIVAIAAGGEFSLALHRNGTVYSWGINEVGQLGTGSTSPGMRNVAAQVINLTRVVAIVAGRNGGLDHALAVDANGDVWAWGYNDAGQLGIGSADAIFETPQRITGLNLN